MVSRALVAALCLVASLASAADSSPPEATAALSAAKTLLRAHHYEEALKEIQKAIAAAPDSAAPLWVRVDIRIAVAAAQPEGSEIADRALTDAAADLERLVGLAHEPG